MLGMLVQFGKHTVVRGLSPDRNVSYLPTRKIEQGCRLNYRVQACNLPCRDVPYQNARTQSPLFVAKLCSRRKI